MSKPTRWWLFPENVAVRRDDLRAQIRHIDTSRFESAGQLLGAVCMINGALEALEHWLCDLEKRCAALENLNPRAQGGPGRKEDAMSAPMFLSSRVYRGREKHHEDKASKLPAYDFFRYFHICAAEDFRILAEAAEALEAAEQEVSAKEGRPENIGEALNSGDGSYKP